MLNLRSLANRVVQFIPLPWHLALVIGCLGLVVHNYGILLLPYERIPMEVEKIRPDARSEHAHTYNYSASFPDIHSSQISRVRIKENDRLLEPRLRNPDETREAGGGRWSHTPGQLLFSASDNSDPRTNGRHYVILSPLLYNSHWGRIGFFGFVLSVAALYGRSPSSVLQAAASSAKPDRTRWSIGGALVVLLLGLYCNTGTLSPCANTYPPYVDPETGYLYNIDHPHFRVLFDFVDGADRSVWDGALMLRRILFPVLAWPFMKVGGFEAGGLVASLLLNLAAFLGFVRLVRADIGPRGATFAAWLLALYPGFHYWAGLPYAYTLIVPSSLLLVFGLRCLQQWHGLRFALVSLGMGITYLGYDLMPLFLPATWLLLAYQRRWGSAVVSTACQVGPLALWLVLLVSVFQQPLENSNTRVYGIILSTYRQITSLGEWWAQVRHFPDVGLNIFFAANFIFLPTLVLALIAVNALTSRIRPAAPEWALLAAGLALFLFNNLVPPYGGWSMRGTWIARIYQPLLPVLILFAARWREHLPPIGPALRAGLALLLGLCLAGNALVVFGPLLHNPFRISERAFYGFYNHTDAHYLYEQFLDRYGRRPVGFPRPEPTP